MPKRVPTPTEEPKRLRDYPPERVASLAADKTVALFLEGKKLDQDGLPQMLWNTCRMEGDGTQVQPFFKQILLGPAYKKLLDIRLRRHTVSAVEEVVFLKDLCRDIAKLAGDAVVEQLLVAPQSVKMNEKRLVFKDAGELYEKLQPPKPPAGEPPVLEASSLEEAANLQAAEVEDRLARMPKELRDRMTRQWKLDEIHRIDAREKELLGLGQGAEQTGDGVPASADGDGS